MCIGYVLRRGMPVTSVEEGTYPKVISSLLLFLCIMEILKHTDMSFTEFDDVTVRRLIDCIQVCGNQKIIVTLKGGYQAEEELRRTEVA